MPDENPSSEAEAPLPPAETAEPPAPRQLTPAAELEALKPHGGQTGGDGAAEDPARPAKEKLHENPNGLTSVVGIGASAGGVAVLQEFFGAMPPDSGLAFVVVMHLSPDHVSNLAEILQAKSKMPIVQVTNHVRVEANHVYVIPPNKHLTMSDGTLELLQGQQEPGRRVAIDLFFRTLAEHYGQRAVCIVMSGTDSDGVIGLKHIKAQGGVTIAQDPTEAEHDSMPRSAIATGMVDWVLPVKEMVPRLLTYVRNERAMKLPLEHNGDVETLPDLAPRGPGGPLVSKQTDDLEDESALHHILAFLRTQTGHDFSQYKRATILRRVARRLQVHSLEDLPSYLEYLYTHPQEARALLHDLLIGVTHFFRDQQAFLALEAQMPHLFAEKRSNEQLRVWVPACATGEEAYSIAILLAEQAMRTPRPPHIQVFATDLDEEAIRIAREGIYPATIEADVSQERLRQYFFNYHGRYRIRKEVRELVLFADHDLLRDSPFSRLDLITCRNLLIYLKPEAQHRAMDIFHFALWPDGILMLGSSEHVDDNHPLFSALDKKHRIYVRRATPRPPVVNLYTPTPRLRRPPDAPVLPRFASPVVASEFTEPGAEQPPGTLAQRRERSLANLHASLVENFAPPSVVVDENYEILHMSAKASKFLHFASGEPSTNLLKLVDETLRTELRTALFRAAQNAENISVPRIRLRHGDATRVIDLHVRPAETDEGGSRVFLVIFDVKPSTEAEQAAPVPQEHGEVTRHHEEEIQHLRQQLAVTIEQAQASQEELKASNEELQAMNEELRSATEELETGKEELQSVNEELTTLNYELKSNSEELSRTNSDLQNLFAATDIGIVFLDRQFRIKRFTPRLQDLFNVLPTDVGRPLADITNKLDFPGLIEQAERVLQTLEKHSSEIQANSNWFVVRMAPYRSVEEKIDGVVISFIDITERKRAEDAMRESEEQFRRAIEDAPIPVIMHAEDGQVLQLSRTWTELTGYGPEDIQTFDAWLNSAYGEGADKVRAYMQELFKGHKQVMNIDFPVKTRAGETRHWSFSASAPGTLRDGRRFIVGMAVDVTGRQQAEEELRAGQARYRTLFELVPVAVYSTDAEGVIQEFNQRAVELWGRTPQRGAEHLCGSRRRFYSDGRPMPHAEYPIAQLLRGEKVAPEDCELIIEQGNGGLRHVVVSPSAIRNEQGEIVAVIDCIYDITERKGAEEKLRLSEERFRQFSENSADVFWIISARTGQLEYLNPAYEKMFGEGRGPIMQDINRWTELIHPQDRDRGADMLPRLLAGENVTVDYRIVRPNDGMVRWIRDSGFPIRDEDGVVARAAGVLQDITEEKERSEALAESEERFRLLIDGAPDYAMFLLDPANRIIYWSSGAERVFGWSADEALGRTGELIFTPEDRARKQEQKEVETALREGVAADRRWHLRKDGSRVWIDGIMRRLDDDRGHLRGFAKIGRDATKMHLAEEALQNSHQELERRVKERTAELTALNQKLKQEIRQRTEVEQELLLVTEREKRRIGQDLHDSLCQELAAAAFFLESSAHKLKSPAQAKIFTEAAKIVNANVGLARDLARGLHPVELSTTGLTNALRELAFRTSQVRSVECRFECPRTVRVRDEAVALNLYRIAQEAVTNSVKNGKARKIVIRVVRSRRDLVLTVQDDGKGFSPANARRGMGIHIMKYRADVIGARFKIESADGQGALVTCVLPGE